VANADDPRVAALADTFPGTVVRFGEGTGVAAEDVQCDARGAARFRLRLGTAAVDVALAIPGRHNVQNALAAAAVTTWLGVDPAHVAAGLAAAQSVGDRMRVVELAHGVTVLNDSYNANPASVRVALASLAASGARRRFAVLGDMLELGDESGAHHRAVGQAAATAGLAALYLYGAYAAETAAGAAEHLPAAAIHVATTHAEIADALARDARAGDWILVKGSRGQRMEEVVRLLEEKD
jgi:UDP-N-acetylmuramoyl-tripeptide--D-alanyl-D-alanine ligase